MTQEIVVLGGGTAGLLAALTLRLQLPNLAVKVIHSTDIGVIGVGEGTTPLFPRHLFHNLRLDPGQFYQQARPIWKLGVRFIWGPRPEFYYSFGYQFDARWSDLPKGNGFYAFDDLPPCDIPAALMKLGKAAIRDANGWPQLPDGYAFHIENALLVEYLTARCRDAGIALIEGTVESVEKGPVGVAALVLRSGERISADLFIDASGFRSELLGRAIGEPFESFQDRLFCDAAVIGGWSRTTEPIMAYTTAETMEAGWAWQIEHERYINRGYVYSSAFLSEEDARKEFLAKNPKIAPDSTRSIRFRCGRHARSWVDNVVAIGNAHGFVEPLEATAISVIIYSLQALVEVLREGPPTAGLVTTYNRLVSDIWDEIRDFLALHYRFNTRIQTPFWRHCNEHTPLGTVQPLVDFYRETGPSMLGRHYLGRHDNIFGLEGHLALLLGQAVPFANRNVDPAESQRWRNNLQSLTAMAANGYTASEFLALIRHPGWRWNV